MDFKTVLMDLMTSRAKRRGWVGLTTSQLAAESGMPVADVAETLHSLAKDGLVTFTMAHGTPTRIRLSKAGMTGAEPKPTEPEPEPIPFLPTASWLLGGPPWYLDGLPAIQALYERMAALANAADILAKSGSPELVAMVRQEAQTVTRVEREVLILVGRLSERGV